MTLDVPLTIALMPVSWCVGQLFQRRGLPTITGNMCTGLAFGPHMLSLAQPQRVEWMWLVESWCLALIALAAGSELNVSKLREQPKPVAYIAGTISILTWLMVFGGFFLASSVLPLTQHLTVRRTYAMASLTATLMIARSPASCLAILQEIEAHGSFSSLVLAVTVISDVLVLVLFSVNLELVVVMYDVKPAGCIAESCVKEVGLTGLVLLVLRPMVMLSCAAALGLSGGWLVLQLTRLRSLVPHQPVMIGLIACAAQALSLTAEYLRIEGLLVCLIAGGLAANHTPPTWPASPRRAVDDRSQRARQALHHALEALLPTCCVIFFTLVGTTLKLSALMNAAPTACLLASLRLVAIALGARLGGKLAGCPSEHCRRLW